MKKLLLLLLITPLFFWSCSDDDKDEDGRLKLSSTYWSSEANNVLTELEFTSETKCNYSFSSGKLTVTNKYTYEIENHAVHLYPEDTDNAKLKGLVSDNRMDVVNTSTGKSIAVLTKR